MSTRIRVNVSDALIAQAKRQAEAARFRRAEQQQLTAAGATIAAAVAQGRQSPADPRSFWQVQRKRPVVAEPPIAVSRKEIAFATFWLEGYWSGLRTGNDWYPPTCRLTLAAPSRNYVSNPLDISFTPNLDGIGWFATRFYWGHYFISGIGQSSHSESGWNGQAPSPKVQEKTIKAVVNQSSEDVKRFLGQKDGSLYYIPDLIGIKSITNGSVSEFRIESEYLNPVTSSIFGTPSPWPSRILLTWGKLGQYTNTVELPSSLSEVYTYTMTWRKQP